MKTALVGYTGFVGSNLAKAFDFDGLYNSKNISDAYHTNPEILVYAGVRAEKFLANANPGQDREAIQTAIENIEKINPRKLVLISTIDIYKTTKDVNENTVIDASGLQPYGANRYYLEQQIRIRYPEAMILRLPALFGSGLKKNFIYDYIHRIPALLTPSKITELSLLIPELDGCYQLQENGFYRYVELDKQHAKKLKDQFEKTGFTALNFTDSRSNYQFYNLKNLWRDICRAFEMEIPLLNVATEPINAAELYHYMSGKDYVNHCSVSYPEYDFRSIYANQLGGQNGYLYSKEQVMEEIKTFVAQELCI